MKLKIHEMWNKDKLKGQKDKNESLLLRNLNLKY